MIANKRVIDKEKVDKVMEDLRHLAFAEFFKEGDADFSSYDKGGMLAGIQNEMVALIERALLFERHSDNSTAIDLTLRFMEKLPEIIRLLHSDHSRLSRALHHQHTEVRSHSVRTQDTDPAQADDRDGSFKNRHRHPSRSSDR